MIKLGVIGYPLKHTLSPVMHNAALSAMGIPGVYLTFEVTPDSLEDAIDGLKALGFMGYNVTIPFKVKIMDYLDSITDEAQLVGAVNTVIIYPSRITIGDNTDIYGFMSSFKEEDKQFLKTKNAAIIGAGGASRAVGCGLIRMGLTKIDIYDVNLEIAQKTYTILSNLAKEKVEITANNIKDINLNDVQLLINASPVGMYPNVNHTPVESDLLDNLDPKAIVYDLVYYPQETVLLKTAKHKDFKTYNGVEMLVKQGARSLGIWTGQEVPISVMRSSLLEVLKDEL